MTVQEVFQQAQTLNKSQRKELAKLLIDSLDLPIIASSEQPDESWGQSLVNLLEEVAPIEMKYSEIEDPVEWVKQLRADENRRRLSNQEADE